MFNNAVREGWMRPEVENGRGEDAGRLEEKSRAEAAELDEADAAEGAAAEFFSSPSLSISIPVCCTCAELELSPC